MQGERAEKRGNRREWWSPRPYRYHEVSFRSGVNKFFKRLTHKAERNEAKKIIEERLNI